MRIQPYRFVTLTQLGIPHGMTRRDPSLPGHGAVSWNAGCDVALQNRRHWWKQLGLPLESTVFGRQVHGARVAIVMRKDAGRGALESSTAIPDTDALVTAERGLSLVVQCADCVPILLYAPDVPAVAAVHAGWRGTTQLIVLRAIEVLVEHLGAVPRKLRAALGPSIGPCCYEVGDEVVEQWLTMAPADGHRAVSRRETRYLFDLWEANRLLLLEAGVLPQHIELAGICTRCHASDWFSYRAAGPRSGAQAAVIALPASKWGKDDGARPSGRESRTSTTQNRTGC